MDYIWGPAAPYLPAALGIYLTLVLFLAVRRWKNAPKPLARLAPDSDRQLDCHLNDRREADEKVKKLFQDALDKEKEADEESDDESTFCKHGVQDCDLCSEEHSEKAVERDTAYAGPTEPYDPPLRSEKVTVPPHSTLVAPIYLDPTADFEMKGLTARSSCQTDFGLSKLKLLLTGENRYLNFTMSDVLSKDTSRPKYQINPRKLHRGSTVQCEITSSSAYPTEVEIILYGKEIPYRPEPPKPRYQIAAIPSLGGIMGHETDEPLYDRCTLKDGSFQEFFSNGHQDCVTGKPKGRADTNLRGPGGALPQGEMFIITGLSLVIETPEIPDKMETFEEITDYREEHNPADCSVRVTPIKETRTKIIRGNALQLALLRADSSLQFLVAQSCLRTIPVRQAIGLPGRDYSNEPAVKMSPHKLLPMECFQFCLDWKPFADGHEITMTLYLFGKRTRAICA